MKYAIEVTKEQMQALELASLILARLQEGQVAHALRELPQWDTSANFVDTVAAFEASLARMPIIPRTENNYVAWDLYKVLRHRLAWDNAVEQGVVASLDAPRNWETMAALAYDTPRRMSKERPLAVVWWR